jgi:hypothetical protein
LRTTPQPVEPKKPLFPNLSAIQPEAGQRFRVLVVVLFEEEDSQFVGLLRVEAA